MTYTKEALFEQDVITELCKKGWEDTVLKNLTEADLLQNWADILFQNNNSIDRLNNAPLTGSEMQQIVEQIAALKTPLKLNGFINGKTVSIKRDNPDDALHYGKEISLHIYDRQEIAAGKSRYQIVQQPRFNRKSAVQHDRRGDLLLLINGMPVIHLELKRSGVPVIEACNQIEKYTHEGHFSAGIIALVQVFVAMTPNHSLYFANPGKDGRFNHDYYFQWADFSNEPVNHWHKVITDLLSIPMAHQLIGFYTVADNADGVLKVMRSYQYYATNAISSKISGLDWSVKNKGGYIWHTTGSGKTMTSFKSAQLIANSGDADKVVFLMDRIELGTQSLEEYRSFADATDEVQGTENTHVLITKLKSTKPSDCLIVTSIQKMSNIQDEGQLKTADIEKINQKRIAFIVDEAHRSTFGDMLTDIKKTFPNAVFFGFTGTPIQEENQKKDSTTSTIFGDELHRYSIGDGIRDGNVLGFDPYKVMTYKDSDLRSAVALEKAKVNTHAEVFGDPVKEKAYDKYMDSARVPMATSEINGKTVRGIETLLPASQYDRIEHKQKVMDDILGNWTRFSRANKFHGIFATHNIPEALEYYRLFKQQAPHLKVTALFDPNIDNKGGAIVKEAGLTAIIEDYNNTYNTTYTLPTHAQFKKDIAARLAHKKPYQHAEQQPDQQLHLLIVVDQMLTGYDSKWVNTLYLDKTLEYANIIQAFSRTNRLFGLDKPFGNIRYYRKPHTMEQNINKALKLYSGDRPFGVFVDKLEDNLNHLNEVFADIEVLFNNEQITYFGQLPKDEAVQAKFASLFNEFNKYLEAAKVQGFDWQESSYQFEDTGSAVDVAFTESQHQTLLQRYKELSSGGDGGGNEPAVPYAILGYLTEQNTGRIDHNYMNAQFSKFLKQLSQPNVTPEQMQQTRDELHKSFASLSQDEQKQAHKLLIDVQAGNLIIESGKTLQDYITRAQVEEENEALLIIVDALGLDEQLLKSLKTGQVTAANLNNFGRFDTLKASVDKAKAKAYLEAKLDKTLPPPKVNIELDKLLREFVLQKED
ncbi:HsdR family type I site-specific deoxyribonuclease [Vibrio sp. 10N.261.52.A1]|uniref:type I restriction endonuclease subunit R, EcoR124 family n=1 Tax=Vibrio sp. 10N.261.52.A1 TaxID=1880849 RepID=UPI000C843934|nr:HsdR family type I site-specific deoxyribonuclease [Vibrio sp. 10N.261.52.A1]PML40300.1 DEAD/DEAH box helicase [Vibrio sp. 10N.261.52.A1]